MDDIEDFLRDDSDNPSMKWGGDVTNLALVIDPSCRATWYPYEVATASNKLYLRVSYITAAELIFAYYINEGHNGHVVLTGTSGTGKSMFANAFIWRLLTASHESQVTEIMEKMSLTGNSDDQRSGDNRPSTSSPGHVNPCMLSYHSSLFVNN